jgi:hypothetical protein
VRTQRFGVCEQRAGRQPRRVSVQDAHLPWQWHHADPLPPPPPTLQPPPPPHTHTHACATQTPALDQWINTDAKGNSKDRKARFALPATPAMVAEAEGYYFHHYMHHFGGGSVGEAFRRIPQVMTWDDHDIFDVSVPPGAGHGGCACMQWLHFTCVCAGRPRHLRRERRRLLLLLLLAGMIEGVHSGCAVACVWLLTPACVVLPVSYCLCRTACVVQPRHH